MVGAPVQDRYLDAQEVADLFDFSRGKVYRLAREGVLPGVLLGSTWRFSGAAIQRVIEGNSPKDDDTR